ncbi:hypothetical protein A1O1_02010 [Capronia coronata CBS 617.96]|uniref:Acyltransferase 3 domain-containing protein n=1 Tax=Capronia coronata CBS 617.96 TaxID=1182541 RepID=W9YM31_9EURO|nr:uncharacterized protein A1O1_02010 [Capronia coronata CBS 617.96]EXJ93618.1 hypothetical protein A1O1_02010 [Capronia coronata CBS 617.96]
MDQAIRLLDEQNNRPGLTTDAGFDVDVDEEDVLKVPVVRRSRWRTACASSINFLRHLLPSYLHALDHTAPRKLHPTAYIDALRGYAAVAVFVYHAFGLPDIWFLQLPIIRVLFDGGSGMVAIFFVISGYVLSYRMLKMIRNREATRLHGCLASSTFRRFIRLYGSTGIATFIAALMVSLRWYIPYGMNPQDTFLEQMWDWFQDFVASSDPFADIEGWVHDGVFRTRYLDQMWTIPIEYRGSIVLFVFCTASSKLSTAARWTFLWIVVVLSYYWRAVYVAEFLFGMFIADLSLSRHPERWSAPLPPRLPVSESEGENEGGSRSISGPVTRTSVQSPSLGLDEKPRLPSRRRWLTRERVLAALASFASHFGYVALLLLGLVLLGQPDQQHSPDLGALTGQFPWPIIAWWIPPWYGDAAYTFWISIGAFFVVLAIDSCPMLQRPFEWRFSQYLGDLSFGIYAMHWPIVYGFYRTVVEPWRATHLGESHLARLPGALLTAVIVLWAADYFTRLDKLVVRSARWVEKKTFIKWE